MADRICERCKEPLLDGAGEWVGEHLLCPPCADFAWSHIDAFMGKFLPMHAGQYVVVQVKDAIDNREAPDA